MSRKFLALTGLVVLLVAGASVGVRQTVAEPAACHKPVVLFESAQAQAVEATDEYVDANIAERYDKAASVNWITANVSTITPSRIAAVIALGETRTDLFGGYEFTGEPRLYRIVLERDCSGDEWKVTKFELAPGEPAEPGGQAPKPNASA